MPANTNNDYVMKNDEWSLQVNLKKTDSETGSQIAADAQYEIYQWDVVTGKYQPTGGYNTYSVQRQGDGTYAVINSAAYATTDAMRHTLYYTQRNQGKFILVETKAPAGYFGDWTDIDHPGTAGTPLGKRAYYIEITQDNDSSVLWLDNADYNADILTADKGGTKLVTGGGVETTVSIYSTANDSTRTYNTDNSGKGHIFGGYIYIAVIAFLGGCVLIPKVFENQKAFVDMNGAVSEIEVAPCQPCQLSAPHTRIQKRKHNGLLLNRVFADFCHQFFDLVLMDAVYKPRAGSFFRLLELGLYRMIPLVCKVQHLVGEQHIFPNCLWSQRLFFAFNAERITNGNAENF